MFSASPPPHVALHVALRLLVLASLPLTLPATPCPVTLPCHCLTDKAVYCAFMRLQTMPFFLEFKTMWTEIDISENFLESLASNAFAGIKVRWINLSRNHVSRLDTYAFQNAEGVHLLDLSHNRVTSLPNNVFYPLAELKVLRLRYNQLSDLGEGALNGISQLEELDLTGNELRRVPQRAMRALVNLTTLSLRANQLAEIGAFSFATLNLVDVDVGENTAPLWVSPAAFCGLGGRGMSKLRLDHNGISQLDMCLVFSLSNISVLDLSGNPLYCHCPLHQAGYVWKTIDFCRAQCAAPAPLAGRYVNFLDAPQGCPDALTQASCRVHCEAAVTESSVVTSSSSRAASSSLLHVIITVIAQFYFYSSSFTYSWATNQLSYQ